MSSLPIAGSPQRRAAALAVGLAVVLAACGGADAGTQAGSTDSERTGSVGADGAVGTEETDDDRLTVVATTSILGDIVGELVGGDGEVVVLMQPGVDPHAYQPSAAEVASLRDADLVIANGLGLVESLESELHAAEEEGVPVFELAPELDPIAAGDHRDDDHGDDAHADDHADDHADEDHGDEDHADEDHGDEDHADEDHADDHADEDHGDEDHADDHADEHAHGELDPHVWFDPVRMSTGVELLAAQLAAAWPAIDADEWRSRADAYNQELLAVHEEMEAILATIPEGDRKLVTNHDAIAYLAERYDLEIVGTVVPGSSTQVDADARQFAALIETVEEAGVSAIFAENTDSTTLAEQLASEVIGRSDVEIEVVRIYTDALGEPGSGADTYLGLLRTTAQLIADALG